MLNINYFIDRLIISLMPVNVTALYSSTDMSRILSYKSVSGPEDRLGVSFSYQYFQSDLQ